MIQITNDIKKANAITHSGTFHADDIFSTIFLNKMMDIILFRTNELPDSDINGKIIFDIGRGQFDHHMENAKKRENNIKYSSFGLLFEKYGRKFLKNQNVKDVEAAYQFFIKDFVMQIDAIDNGIFPPNPKDYTITPLSQVIELFNPTWEEKKNTDEAFLEGISLGEKIFDRMTKQILDKIKAKEYVEKAIQESTNQILILPKYMPFMEFVLTSKNKKASELLYAIFPSNRGGYNIKAINKELGSYENRLDFPKAWSGKTQEELQKITHIKTFHFCHSNRFLCACSTLEDAIQVATLAKENRP